MKYFISSIFYVTFIISIIGCSDDPSELGLGLISPEDTLKLTSIVTKATKDSTFLYRITGASRLMIGNYSNTEINSSIHARGLIQFTGFKNIPENSIIESAVINTPINYTLGDSSHLMVIETYEILRSWNKDSFIWDSVDNNFYNSTPDSAFLLRISETDTAILRIDKLVRKWVKNRDSSQYGIILVPQRERLSRSDRGIIIGTNNPSLLTVTYRDSADSVRIFETTVTQQSYIADGTPPSASERLFLQAGIGYRGLIRFDSLNIPARVSISDAKLELLLDNSLPNKNSIARDSILVHLLRKNSYPYDSLAWSTFCKRSDKDSNTYIADIRTIVQQWILGAPNYGIVIRPYGESSTFDRFALHGVSAPEILRPKLTITYTELP
ncbi:MAG: DNRLRE domain-containing protein [Bacteroidota bacterium]|nr:DNRLRE domain-containing protein [Bacteroidota bacterium]